MSQWVKVFLVYFFLHWSYYCWYYDDGVETCPSWSNIIEKSFHHYTAAVSRLICTNNTITANRCIALRDYIGPVAWFGGRAGFTRIRSMCLRTFCEYFEPLFLDLSVCVSRWYGAETRKSCVVLVVVSSWRIPTDTASFILTRAPNNFIADTIAPSVLQYAMKRVK